MGDMPKAVVLLHKTDAVVFVEESQKNEIFNIYKPCL